MEELTDIAALCEELGVSSRTLRFYEEEGIITSTRDPYNQRRKYGAGQIDEIKKVLVLRSLGLTVAKIRELMSDSAGLAAAISEHKAKIHALIAARRREIELLEEALAVIEAGGDLFSRVPGAAAQVCPEHIAASDDCTDAIVSGELLKCYPHFSPKLSDYMPPDIFKKIMADVFLPLGKFVRKGEREANPKHPNVIYRKLEYERLGLRMKYVFANNKINGIWADYYEL